MLCVSGGFNRESPERIAAGAKSKNPMPLRQRELAKRTFPLPCDEEPQACG
jgi:hypothetical protein